MLGILVCSFGWVHPPLERLQLATHDKLIKKSGVGFGGLVVGAGEVMR